MKLLLLADKESRYLWDFYKPGCLREYDLMLSCGDLKAEYLTFLATLGRSPLLYVRGNHDDNYESRPPEGCECIEDKLVTVGGLRIVGLGVDIVLTHAPARGFGDAEDFAHCGFEAFLPLLDRYQPRYLIHGHVHTEYGHAIPRVLQRGGTTIINACERYTLEL